MKDPIFITGIARSGTSFVAGILELCGVFGGIMSPPDKDHVKGMFENVQIRETIEKPYLKSIGADKFGQFPLPNISNIVIPLDWKNKVEQIIKKEGYDEHMNRRGWMYKSTKMCMYNEVWNYAFPNAKWIIVRRKDDEIVHSCMNTAYMSAFNSKANIQAVQAENTKDAWYWWVRQHNMSFVRMIENGLNVKQIHPERMVNGDYSQVNEMLDWLGLEWNSRIPTFIEPRLWTARKNKEK